jgi:hypothetical protein
MTRRVIISVFSAMSGLIVLTSVGMAQQKTVEACVGEWRSDKVNMQTKGVTEEAYVARCLQGAIATPSAAPAAPAPALAAPAAPTAVAPGSPAPKRSSVGVPPAELQFETARQAKDHCPTDTVVWANLSSKVYHFYGERGYGSTRRGAYVCEADALSVGMKSGKNEKHP